MLYSLLYNCVQQTFISSGNLSATISDTYGGSEVTCWKPETFFLVATSVSTLLPFVLRAQALYHGSLPFDRKIRLRFRKHNGKRFTSLPQKCHIRYGLNPKEGRICVAWVWNREGTEKLVNGKQHSVWFVPTGMKGLPQNVLLNFRLEFPKSDLTIYVPSGISSPKFSVKW